MKKTDKNLIQKIFSSNVAAFEVPTKSVFSKTNEFSKTLLTPDLCIIGAGSGGLSLAAGSSQLGMDVVLLEKNKMGGDCLNTGCVPSKALLAAAKRAQTHRKSDILGISPNEPEIDFGLVKDHVFDTIKMIEPNDSVQRFQKLGVHVILQAGEFIDEKSVETEHHIIQAKKFIIATGSKPFIPFIDGLDEVPNNQILTNENIFELRQKPEHLLIIGGGPIGIEMAGAHQRLGVKVSVFDLSQILPKDDADHVAILKNALIKEGIDLYEKIKIQSIQYANNQINLTIEKNGKPKQIKGSHILVATGRLANLDGLGLDKAGIEYDKKGIKVNAHLKTSNKRVFAIGDAIGPPQFTHIASYHASLIIRQLCFGMFWSKVDYRAIPWVTYTEPELAQVGLTEAEARKKYGEKIKVSEWKLSENDRAIAERTTCGQIKVITNKKGLILGASIVGSNAGELIGLWALAIKTKQKIGAIASMIAPYPTLTEVSKRAAGAWFTPSLFSEKTKKIVRILKNFS